MGPGSSRTCCIGNGCTFEDTAPRVNVRVSLNGGTSGSVPRRGGVLLVFCGMAFGFCGGAWCATRAGAAANAAATRRRLTFLDYSCMKDLLHGKRLHLFYNPPGHNGFVGFVLWRDHDLAWAAGTY